MRHNEHDRAFGEARRVLRYLLLGVDPDTDQPLTEASHSATPEVKAALATGIEELRLSPWMQRWSVSKRRYLQPSWHAARSARPAFAGSGTVAAAPRSGIGWSLQEDQQIAQEFAEGQKLTMMATNHQRSRGSVLNRLIHLGLMKRGS